MFFRIEIIPFCWFSFLLQVDGEGRLLPAVTVQVENAVSQVPENGREEQRAEGVPKPLPFYP
jgi:hypothetical protein